MINHDRRERGRKLLAGITHGKAVEAITCTQAGATDYGDASAGALPGCIWVLRVDDQIPIQAYRNGKVNPGAVGAYVWVAKRRVTGILEVTDTNFERNVGAHGEALAEAMTAPRIAPEFQQVLLPGENLHDLRVRAPDPDFAGLYVCIEAGQTEFGARIKEHKDVSAYLPATTGTRWWVKAYVDTDKSVKFSTSGSLETTLSQEDMLKLPAAWDAITIPAGAYPLYVFTLDEDQTAVNESASVFKDVRLHYARAGAATTLPAFGAGVVKTLDGSGVAALGTDRHILLAANSGTSDTCTGLTGLAVGEEAWLFADAGDTITLQHNGGASDEFQFYNGVDIVLTGDQGIKVFKHASGVIVNSADEDTGGGVLGDYIVLQDQKAQNTAGGTATSGSWETRDLNTEVVDTGNHCTLSSHQFTLAANTYRFRFSVPGHFVDRHQARLYNVSDSAVVAYGSSEYSANSNAEGDTTSSVGVGRFTLASSKTLRLEHQVQTTFATNGHGVAANFGTEVYSMIELWVE